MKAPFVRSPYNYDMLEASTESGLKCEDVSLTVQEPRDECDINTIVERFGLTGHLPVIEELPMQGDFTGVSSFQEALLEVQKAQATFDSLPANLRTRFANNAGMFVDFCSDPANKDELGRLGLLKPVEAPPAPILVQMVGSTPGTGSEGS